MCERKAEAGAVKNSYLAGLFADSYSDKWLWGGVKWDLKTMERMQNPGALENYGFKVYSQNDEDGMIEEIFHRIGTVNKIFIEFGVQDGLESNTHYLLFKDWSGLWIECDKNAFQQICRKFVNVIKDGQLMVRNEFVTKDNINRLFQESGISGEIDLLSIDVDGNDYYIFEHINAVCPRVVIMEYNGKFPPDCFFKQAYNEEHVWDGTDWHGASLCALNELAVRKGYVLAGTNINGCNAFFIRKDLVNDQFLQPMTPEYLFNPMRVNLKHKSGHPSGNCLYKMRDGIGGVLDFYPDAQICFVCGFSQPEKNEWYRYCYMNELHAKIYVREQETQAEELVLEYLNPFGHPGFVLHVHHKGRLVQRLEIQDGEGKIRIPKNALESDRGYALELTIDRLLVPAKVSGGNDERALGIGLKF